MSRAKVYREAVSLVRLGASATASVPADVSSHEVEARLAANGASSAALDDSVARLRHQLPAREFTELVGVLARIAGNVLDHCDDGDALLAAIAEHPLLGGGTEG